MSNKVLLGVLLLSSAIIGAMAVQLSDSPQAVAQGVGADSEWYPYQLVIAEDQYGNQRYVRFNRETGVLDTPLGEDGKIEIESPPTTPPTYSAFQYEIDKKGDIVVFESDTGKVWKAKGKQWSNKWNEFAKRFTNNPIFEPDN